MTVHVVLLIVIGGVSLLAWNNPILHSKLIFNPYLVHHRKEWWRFLTSGFIHADYLHLGFNLYVFHSFGKMIYEIFTGTLGRDFAEREAYQRVFGYGFGETEGALAFLFLFFAGVVVAHIPTYFKQKDNPGYNSLGASGGVSSVVFAFMMLAPDQHMGLLFLPRSLGIPAIIFGLLYLGYSHWASKKNRDNINHEAHFWGGAFGIVFVLVTYPNALDIFLAGLGRIIN